MRKLFVVLNLFFAGCNAKAAEEAARAYNEAALKYFGAHARINAGL